MLLKEILQIKPGTLIKGLAIETDRAMFNLRGWEKTKFVWKYPVFPVSIQFIKNEKIQKNIKEQGLSLSSVDNISLLTLEKNYRIFSYFIGGCFDTDNFKKDEIIGLSLGENIVTRCVGRGIYNLDLEEITCFHKTLLQKNIVWIRLCSFVRINYFNEQTTIRNCLNCPMWIKL